jgi:hypothetical protein
MVEYLGAFGRSYVVQLQYAPTPLGQPINHSIEGNSYWQKLEGQKIALVNIMVELRRTH